MKLVIAWLGLLVVAAITAGSCSINHKSTDYECSKQSDCAAFPGRTCTGGYCVTTGGPADARVDSSIDAPAACPPQCSSCNAGKMECTVDCSITSCNAAIVCPSGWNCNILCNTANSCQQGIDCTEAESCSLTCSGTAACHGLECGSGRCRVMCTGSQSCREIDCHESCGCDLSCSITARCTELQCPTGCAVGLKACSSASDACDTCNDGM